MKMNIKNSTKQVFKHSTLVVLAAAMSLSSCKDKEVAPKPEAGITAASIDKAFENGFVKGTIKGTRRDGTAFEEPFEYKVNTNNTVFTKVSSTEHAFSLSRGQGFVTDNNNIHFGINVTNKDQAGASAKLTYSYLEFSKVLADKRLFYLSAVPNFVAKNVTLPMSRVNNQTYKLVSNGSDIEWYTDQTLQENFYVLKDTDGNSIYFSTRYEYDALTGDDFRRFSYIVSSTGVKSNTSTLWGNVRMYFNDGNNREFRTSTGTNLSEMIAVPADTQEITNFAYNATTGLVTFDYKLNISEFRSFDNSYLPYGSANNTTDHALEIKGSVSATVHNEMVMRRSAQ